jgi:transposase
LPPPTEGGLQTGAYECITQLDGGIPNIPTSSNRKTRFRRKKAVYRERNHVERFFDELKQLRGIAIRYDKRRATFFAFI